MSTLQSNFSEPKRAARYLENGPPAFAPGHSGMLQMTGVLLSERVPADSQVLVVGAGGGLEIRYLAGVARSWHFVGVDPAPAMLELRAPRRVQSPARDFAQSKVRSPRRRSVHSTRRRAFWFSG